MGSGSARRDLHLRERNIMNYLNVHPEKFQYRQEKLAIDLPIYEVFKRIYTAFPTVFFLESLGELGDFSRYSIIGFEPRNHITARKSQLTVDGTTHDVDNPLFALREIQQIQLPLSSFCGGLVGYISYEGTRYFEPTANFKDNPLFPDFEFGLYTDGIIYDKKTKDFFYFYLEESRKELIENVVRQPVHPEPFSFEELGPTTSEAEHKRIVETCLEHIKAGDIFQIIASVQFTYRTQGSLLHLYESLREINPSPHMVFFKFGERQILAASPELVVRFQVDHSGMLGNRIENFPLAGTTVRGITPREDATLATDLLEDPKERAEHMMLVDLGRNDIGRVSKFGSVEVTNFMGIKKYSHVQHIASEIEGEVREDKDAFDCIAATCPMGTVTGAPKVEAMKIANHLEKDPRGPYSGELGYISFNGDCAFCVGLRSLFAVGDFAYTQQGGGIVFDSTPEYEYREILRKGAGMTKALEQTKERSQAITQRSYTLEEIRIKLDRCGEKLLRAIAEQWKGESPNNNSLTPAQWYSKLFASVTQGLEDDTIRTYFASLQEDSPEIADILAGKSFKDSPDIYTYFTKNCTLSSENFIVLTKAITFQNHEVLELLQERFSWIQHVAYYKKDRGITLRKRDREATIITQAVELLSKLDVPEHVAWVLYTYVIFPIAFAIERQLGVTE